MRQKTAYVLGVILVATTAFAQPKKAQGGDSPAGTPGATPTQVVFTQAADCPAIEYPIAPGSLAKKPVSSIGELVAEYNGAVSWSQLQSNLKTLLAGCGFATKIKPTDFDKKAFLVIFLLRDTVYYVVLPQEQPYDMTLLGVSAVDVVILGDAKAKGSTPPTDFIFASTRIQNPLEAQIPQFVQQIAGGVIPKGAKGAAGNTLPTKPGQAAMYAYLASGLALPFTRASISAKGTVSVACSPDKATELLAKCAMSKDTTVDVPISTTYTNTPRTRAEFTAVAGAVVGPFYGHPKMKVDSSKYASDPLAKAMTMAGIAVHFKAYNGALTDMSKAERWSVLLGGVITPAPGLGVGLSAGIVRGFSINVGELIVWVPTSADGSAPGADAITGGNQLKTRPNWGTFVGGNYVFKSGS